jgi:hypothetical protein
MAIEAQFQDLVEAARNAGWNEVEALTAIIEVADNRMPARRSNADLGSLLTALRRNLE